MDQNDELERILEEGSDFEFDDKSQIPSVFAVSGKTIEE